MIKMIKQKLSDWQQYKSSLKETSLSKYRIIDTVETLLVALVVALVIRHFVVMASVVPTGSMIPTLRIEPFHERLFVNKFIYKFSTPKRGDIVVFKSPFNDKKDYVKRCIGLPGDKLKIARGTVYINGKILVIPGVNAYRDYSYFDEIEVPPNNYFMLGDNRSHSLDSRFWKAYGYKTYVPKENLVGKALFTFWPFNRMRILK
jgi:signal peptidase I